MISLMISRRGWWGREAGGKKSKIFQNQAVKGASRPLPEPPFRWPPGRQEIISYFSAGLPGRREIIKEIINYFALASPAGGRSL